MKYRPLTPSSSLSACKKACSISILCSSVSFAMARDIMRLLRVCAPQKSEEGVAVHVLAPSLHALNRAPSTTSTSQARAAGRSLVRLVILWYSEPSRLPRICVCRCHWRYLMNKPTKASSHGPSSSTTVFPFSSRGRPNGFWIQLSDAPVADQVRIPGDAASPGDIIQDPTPFHQKQAR
jgi:hypothetical protein